jgi:hypothetical protein
MTGINLPTLERPLMKKTRLVFMVLLAALCGPALAQGTAAPAAGSSDPLVQKRAERGAADKAFNKGKAAAQAERDAKVKAAVNAALKDPGAKGKDPQVVQREARDNAMKQTKPEYDAKIKKLSAERKAADAAAEKKYKAAAGK